MHYEGFKKIINKVVKSGKKWEINFIFDKLNINATLYWNI